MALISFTCASPAASWSPSINPKREGGYIHGENKYQPKGIAGSSLYSYDHGTSQERILEWTALPDADMTSLLIFVGVMKGGRYKFTFNDYDSTVYTACRILNFENLRYRLLLQTFYNVTLELEVA